MLKSFLLGTVVTFTILQHATFTDAFSSQILRPVRLYQVNEPCESMTKLRMRTDDISNGPGDFFDLEATRRQLESLVGSGSLEQVQHEFREVPQRHKVFASIAEESSLSLLPEPPKLEISLPTRPPLTTIERERRSAEIELLAQLNDGDEAQKDIWNLWFSERGPHAAKLLQQADDLINQGAQGWNEAEEILRLLIEENGVYFPEPLNRLATLYYLQGRLEEALTLNQMVLAVKPWHFGALSHIVMVYAALHNSVAARQWASFRLPPFSPDGSGRRRARWVERAVLDATILLHEGEKSLVKAFGESDKQWMETQQRISNIENDATAWQ